MDTIVVCAMLQSAAPGILEWIAFHRLIGVDRFVLYDLGNTDGSAALIARSRFGRQVTVIDWPGEDGQATVYPDFVANHAHRFTWAIIIGLDEFIHPLEADTIRALLPRYDGFSAVLLRRLSFARPAQPIRPGQLVLGSFTTRVPDDTPLNGAPTLLRVADLTGVGGAQTSELCNARGERVTTPTPPDQACDDMMVVNHYPVRPVAEAPRTFLGNRPTDMTPAGAPAGMQDRRILRFIPRLRAMLHDASLAAQPRPAPPPATPTPTPPPAAPLLLGIGIVTYNRQAILRQTLDRVQQHTRHPRTVVAVADDGSTDGTLDMLRARQVLTVTGRNMSIAWNKNRALFLLSELLRCDVVVLLEDDAYPSEDNWEVEWMKAAIRWGHANVAPPVLREHFLSGAGTVDDPILSRQIAAQCATFSREALLFGGYFDTRFRGYGHEHVEHTCRLLRMGYGGPEQSAGGQAGPLFKLLSGGISYHLVQSVVAQRDEQAERNRVLAQQLFGDFSYRAPWQNEAEARQLRDEMRHSFPRAAL